ncbi:hypothetical protein ACK3TF_003352 [Chlorella vulgaris]
MPSGANWLLALLVALLLSTCHGLQYQHDELLWTKQNWQDYKLPFPWSAAVKQRDTESSRQLQGPLAGFPSNSLNGPLMDAGLVATQIEEDARRGPLLQVKGGLDVSLLDEAADIDAAAGVSQCKVCGVLVRRLWEGLTRWVDARQQVPSKHRISDFALELCEVEVPIEVLEGWVLHRARLEQGEGLPFTVEGQTQEFYMLSQRGKQHATPYEIQAVRQACEKLLREHDAGQEKPQVLQQASSLLHKYFQLSAQRRNKGQGAAQVEAVEAVDDGPRPQRQCLDLHPQCKLWQEKGECESNPKYMLGDDGANNGWCRAACGRCQPPGDEGRYQGLPEEDAVYLQTAQADLLAVLESKACVTAAPCKWAAGQGTQQLLATAKAGADSSSAALLDKAAFIGGPLLSQQQQVDLALDQTRLKESRPMVVRDLNDAIVPNEGAFPRSVQPPETFTTNAATEVWQELGAKCLYLSTGWWMYEVCYMHHINQVPYASQLYSSGGRCDLDPDESGLQHSVLRSTELRLMCSPDSEAHIIALEPEQCRYLLELYLPKLCDLPGFQIELPADVTVITAATTTAAARSQAGRRQRGSSSTVDGSAGAGGEEAFDPQYVLPDTEGDEYDDADEGMAAEDEQPAEQGGEEQEAGSIHTVEGDERLAYYDDGPVYGAEEHEEL